jgi:chromosome partitioning protein
MRTIAVVNQKGGCGKTITAINLSAFLARAQRRVLLVDMDPQGHATLGLLTDSVWPTRTMYEVFSAETGRQQTCLREITRNVRENLDLAPADILLSAIPETLAGVAGREDMLHRALSGLESDYDYVVVDCPPNVGLLTFNALKACSEAIIPMDPSFFSLHGIGKLLETFDVLQRKADHRIVPCVLVTLYSGRTVFVKAVVEEIRNHLEGRHFDTTIRYSVKLGEAASHGLPIADYCTNCAGYDDYRSLAAEVLQQEQGAPARLAAVNSDTVSFDSIPVDVVPVGSIPMDSDSVPGPAAPEVTSEGVRFTIEAPDAERVQLVGDFNDWSADGNEMEPAGGIWRKVVKLPPGSYRYRYVVDGRWQSDPLNGLVEPSPFGGHNSVFVLNQGFAE